MTDFVQHLTRQAAFSRATFGPGPRTKGVLDHIGKEMKEVEEAANLKDRKKEWGDIAILGMDGLLRAVREELEAEMILHNATHAGPPMVVTHDHVAQEAVRWIVEKQGINELRDYPDWRTMSADGAIEHIRKPTPYTPGERQAIAERPHPPVTAPIHRASDLHPPAGDPDV